LNAAAPKPSPIKKIPLILLTGFLGSGKTTLLRQMLTMPGWRDTLVLINELGAVGLDHHLLWGASDQVHLMENGCLCCSVRDDLAGVLEDLFWRRLQRQIPTYDRVVIETTGLADPGPVIAALLSNPLVVQRYQLDGVLCTVDAMHAQQQLTQHPESLAQAMAADILLLTKTDLVQEAHSAELEQRLELMNPLALVQRSQEAAQAPTWLADLSARSASRLRTVPSYARLSASRTAQDGMQLGRPSDDFQHAAVQTLCLHFERPWDRAAFDSALDATLALYGAALLRIKGLIDIVDEPAPLVIQAVQQTRFPIERLAAWPEGQRDSFLVFISIGLGQCDVGHLFRSHTHSSFKTLAS
jgi:G3E family GTPase